MVQGFDVDRVVVGSGGAGMAAAITARRAGKEMLVIERCTLGVTVVNTVDVAVEALLATACNRDAVLSNLFPGVPTSSPGVDLVSRVVQKYQLISRQRDTKYAEVAASHGFQIRTAEVSFVVPDTLG